MAFFGTFDFGEDVFNGGPTTPTIGVRFPWILQEADGVDYYEFAINPLSAKMPSVRRTITRERTATGNPILFQGRSAPQVLSFSGTILTEEHLNALRTWVQKETQVHITDDLGRGYWVYFTTFSPTRQRSNQSPWRHEFSAEAIVLNW